MQVDLNSGLSQHLVLGTTSKKKLKKKQDLVPGFSLVNRISKENTDFKPINPFKSNQQRSF
jgi:hypothetical protein